MKQLFSRDSSKKSKKEKEVQPKARTRVLKSPEHLVADDSDYKRYLSSHRKPRKLLKPI